MEQKITKISASQRRKKPPPFLPTIRKRVMVYSVIKPLADAVVLHRSHLDSLNYHDYLVLKFAHL